ncbi:MAG: hypothetical protein M3R13_05155 [Armatimonadota bacterium]|nr:hypothetical protein [Armatimonadota bacterium]
MPITLSLLALGSGCKDAQRQSVWVDLSAAARVMKAEAAIDWPTLASTSLAVASTVVSLPGLSSSVIDRTVVANRRADAIELLADQLRDTQTKLEEAYRVQLRASARVLAADLREALRERSTEGSEASISAISSILEASAEVRGPIIVRLGLLVGWPDDGRSDFVRFASQKGPVEEAWDAEAARLRAELEEHDRWVTRRIEAILSQFDEMIASERTLNEQRIQAEIRRADAMAANMARERFAETARLTLPRLLSGASTVMPGRGATTLSIPGSTGTETRTQEPAAFPIPYEVLRSRLEIWLEIHGYKLAPGAGSAPDLTGEFIAWINQP